MTSHSLTYDLDFSWDRIKSGNIDEFDRMFRFFYSPLCEYASQFIPDHESEELVQTFMVYLWENRSNIEVSSSLKSYLFLSVKNRCLNAIRNKRTKERIHSFIYERMKEKLDDPDYYLANELAVNIDKAIAELPETYRETFELSRFGSMSNARIAGQLGVSVKTVEYRITRSLKLLRVKLKDYLPLLLFLLNV